MCWTSYRRNLSEWGHFTAGMWSYGPSLSLSLLLCVCVFSSLSYIKRVTQLSLQHFVNSVQVKRAALIHITMGEWKRTGLTALSAMFSLTPPAVHQGHIGPYMLRCRELSLAGLYMFLPQ